MASRRRSSASWTLATSWDSRRALHSASLARRPCLARMDSGSSRQGRLARLAECKARQAPLPCAHGLWQLVPPHALAEGVVRGPVDGRSLGEDGRDLGLDGLLGAVG